MERLNGGTASWLEEADRSLCRDGMSVKRVKYDDIIIRWCTAVQSSVGHYGDLEPDAFLNAKPAVEADERVSDVLGAPHPAAFCTDRRRRIKLAGNPAKTLLQ